MLRHLLLATAILTSALSGPVTAEPAPIDGARTVGSPHDVASTAERLERQLRAADFLIKGRIDHQEIAAGLGHDIAPNLAFLVGKPTFEYPLIADDPRAALFVPLTLVVWQDAAGNTQISYWDPVNDIEPLLKLESEAALQAMKAMSATLEALTAAATAQ